MTKLEELNMQLDKCEAIKETLLTRTNELEKNRKKYSIENDKLIKEIKNLKISNRNSKLLILLTLFLSFLGANVLLDLNLGIIYEQLIKILALFIPIINFTYQIKNIKKNNKKLLYLNDQYYYVSQDLFAEEFFLKNTKNNIMENDQKIEFLKEQINLLLKGYVNNIWNYDNIFEKSNNYSKKLIKVRR